MATGAMYGASIFVVLLLASAIWTGYKLLHRDEQRLRDETRKFIENE